MYERCTRVTKVKLFVFYRPRDGPIARVRARVCGFFYVVDSPPPTSGCLADSTDSGLDFC